MDSDFFERGQVEKKGMRIARDEPTGSKDFLGVEEPA